MCQKIKYIISSICFIAVFTNCGFAQQSMQFKDDKPAEISSPVIPTNITMYKYYPSRTLYKSTNPFKIPNISKNLIIPQKASFNYNGKNISFQKYLKNTETVAFLLIKNDTILFEKYFSSEGKSYDTNSIFTSFSVAKSFVSALVGIAINLGYIKSIDEPITKYVSGLPVNKGFEKIKIRHLLQMTSGIKFNEDAGTSSDMSNLYQVADIKDYLKHIEIEKNPGSHFLYKSIDSQLLGLILVNATGKTLTKFLQEKLWEPLGMEYDASWNLDKVGGVERAYSCINTNARDFAKLGLLYLHKGKWNGKQLVPESWIKESIKADINQGGSSLYKYQWWLFGGLLGDSHNDYAAIGILGQFIYVNPEKNIVIVKFSNKKTDYKMDYELFRSIVKGF